MKLIIAWLVAAPFLFCLGLVLSLPYPFFWAMSIISGEDPKEYLPWNLIKDML